MSTPTPCSSAPPSRASSVESLVGLDTTAQHSLTALEGAPARPCTGTQSLMATTTYLDNNLSRLLEMRSSVVAYPTSMALGVFGSLPGLASASGAERR